MAEKKEELTEAQKEYRATIDQYKRTNPTKYESKKVELEEKYSRVIGITDKKDTFGRSIFIFSEKKK